MATLPQLLGNALVITAPIADTKLLMDDLQANIIKGHGRSHTAHMFLTFTGGNQAAIRTAFKKIAKRVTSASQQEAGTAAAKAGGVSPPVFCLFLTKAGYQSIGAPAAQLPGDPAFREGMAARGKKSLPSTQGPGRLNDPDVKEWDEHFGGGELETGEARKIIHAMLLVADDVKKRERDMEEAASGPARAQLRRANNSAGKSRVDALINAVTADLAGTPIAITGIDLGHAYRMKVGAADVGIENFGYMDGRSQPLFTKEEQDRETHVKWSAKFPPAQFIVKDPGSPKPFACGSYFVFRKLEQNVRGFKKLEDKLADALGLNGAARERAGAMVVGRFENGAPIISAGSDADTSVPNDFSYADDSGKCPFSAHIRKTNPRGDIMRQGLAAGDVAERKHIMARRGITYGARDQDDNGGFLDSPAGGVGLLFMAYMSNIREQFEFTQANWANDENFVSNLDPALPKPKPGIDPVLGQGKSVLSPKVQWTDNWSVPPKSAGFSFADFVNLRGGDYYFAPSVSFLKSI